MNKILNQIQDGITSHAINEAFNHEWSNNQQLGYLVAGYGNEKNNTAHSHPDQMKMVEDVLEEVINMKNAVPGTYNPKSYALFIITQTAQSILEGVYHVEEFKGV